MSRKSEFESTNRNPATKFLEWKSVEKCLSYYDKGVGKNVLVEIPFKFLVLKILHVIKGFNDASRSSIFSNEVKYIGTEEVEVKSFKGGIIAKGLWKEIKGRCKDAGAVYHKSIYVMTDKGDIMNLVFKGSAAAEWGEFTKKTMARLTDEWVSITKSDPRKKGATRYNVPVFEFDKSLSAKEGEMADKAYDEIDQYMAQYAEEEVTPKAEQPVTDDEAIPDLDI